MLHLKHGLDDEGGANGLQDETEREGKGGWHAEDGDGNAAVKEGLADAWHQQQPHCGAAHPPEDLRSSTCDMNGLPY